MIWFGSSAGVALTNMFPKAKSVVFWIKDGWHVTLGYIIGFFAMLYLAGWHPHAPHKEPKEGMEVKEHSQVIQMKSEKDDCCKSGQLKACLPDGKTVAVK